MDELVAKRLDKKAEKPVFRQELVDQILSNSSDLVLEQIPCEWLCKNLIASRAGLLALFENDLNEEEDYYVTQEIFNNIDTILAGLSKKISHKIVSKRNINGTIIGVDMYKLKGPEEGPDSEDDLSSNVLYINFRGQQLGKVA